ncbi:hypothetical protein Dsin_013300 [Dipteronia sinensis]|uniref:Leucine-rich repeat-containing N-terminal plant-type domain-containing protein n=1 Tax=Dipteronia sinensis TaxID=43782 RepID=A0AAE0AKK6_9ROSI|nr:hypothetical protein Dsin_013300 [Dipteronia sinensis]
MAKMNLSLFGLFMIFFFLFNLCLSCPGDQKQALVQFKSMFMEATNSSADDPLFGLYSWNSSSDCCQWERVICSTISQSRPVIALYLDSLVLISFFEVTTISSRVLTPLFGVTSLMILDISSNYIQGEIPGHCFCQSHHIGIP